MGLVCKENWFKTFYPAASCVKCVTPLKEKADEMKGGREEEGGVRDIHHPHAQFMQTFYDLVHLSS